MVEQQKTPKFGLLKCPFALREEVIRNMEFMDTFHFSTLSKRSKQMVHKAKYQTMFIAFRFEEDSRDDHIEMEIKHGEDDHIEMEIKHAENLKISLSDSNDSSETDQKPLDGRKLASLIDGTSGDYRKKLSAHLLFIFHFEVISVQIGRKIENVDDLFLWSIRKQFDSVGIMTQQEITPEYLQLVLNTAKAKEYYLDFKMDDLNFKYQLKDCESLDASGSIQWLDMDGILQRNPQMKHIHLEELPGKHINDLLKQWINGQVTDLENLEFFNRRGYRDHVILDGIGTMKTKLKEDQAIRIFMYWTNDGRKVDIQRKIDGKFATVHVNRLGCYVHMWHESELSKI
ncbi:hypothetical protein B9Z55_015563 [Caenorhabditis nigoni]|nr:hypothetical protein B9Z55_015563 [Caenorhabditis nigoni]